MLNENNFHNYYNNCIHIKYYNRPFADCVIELLIIGAHYVCDEKNPPSDG